MAAARERQNVSLVQSGSWVRCGAWIDPSCVRTPAVSIVRLVFRCERLYSGWIWTLNPRIEAPGFCRHKWLWTTAYV